MIYWKYSKINYDLDDWTLKKDQFYKKIKDTINFYIIDDYSDWSPFIKDSPLSAKQSMNICKTLYDGLYILTNNKEWCSTTSNKIILSIEGNIEGLLRSKIWDTIYDKPTQISDMLYYNIEYLLDTILEDIPTFSV